MIGSDDVERCCTQFFVNLSPFSSSMNVFVSFACFKFAKSVAWVATAGVLVISCKVFRCPTMTGPVALVIFLELFDILMRAA